jgi:hypothetical protein
MTADEIKLVERLRQQRRAHWGLDLPPRPVPTISPGLWLLAPYLAGIACWVALLLLSGW